jgi:hypothetical protein
MTVSVPYHTSYHTHIKVHFITQNQVNLKAKKLCNEGHHNLNFTKYYYSDQGNDKGGTCSINACV